MRRDGHEIVIDARELVPGDIVILKAGDRVPADVLLLEGIDVAVDVSTFTGESVPINPSPGDAIQAGTYLTRGRAIAVVTATGANTRLAQLARLTAAPRRQPTPLTRELQRLVRIITVLAVSVGLLFFAVAVFLRLPVLDAFVFMLGVTVALVPEGLLPTLTLSRRRCTAHGRATSTGSPPRGSRDARTHHRHLNRQNGHTHTERAIGNEHLDPSGWRPALRSGL